MTPPFVLHFVRRLGVSLITLGVIQSLSAQGPLPPPGAPAPTMKSLQELWDKLGVLQTQNQTLQTTVTNQTQILNALADVHGLVAWNINTVDGAGNVGEFTSLAFTPAGQPAISYYDNTNGNLKYAVFNGTTWQLTRR